MRTQALVEWLSPAVAALDLMPVGDLVLAQLPAEIDLVAVTKRGEVDEAPVDVADNDPSLLKGAEQAADLDERLAHLATLVATTVGCARLGKDRVRLFIGQPRLGIAKLAQNRLNSAQQGIRLLDREVELVLQRSGPRGRQRS